MCDSMPSHNPGGKATLGQGLDQQIYLIILKYKDEAAQFNRPLKLSVPLIYQHIHKSNSSLARKSKKLLESSISRVIGVIQHDAESEDEVGSVEGDFNRIADDDILPTNGVNKSIVGLWEPSTAKPDVVTTPAIVAEGKQSAPLLSKKRTFNGEPRAKRRRVTSVIDRFPPTNVNLDDVGGAHKVIKELVKLLIPPFARPELFIQSGVKHTHGILLHGPPGCGKTLIANAIAAICEVSFIPISAPSIIAGMSGESEKALREYFEEAKSRAPCLIFMDEVDAITTKRELSQQGMEKRIVAQLLTCMDNISLDKTGGKAVIVLAATNRPHALDPALRRAGRFGQEVQVDPPDVAARELILSTMTRYMPLAADVSFCDIAEKTPGFVGADLSDLVRSAFTNATDRQYDAYLEQEDPPGTANTPWLDKFDSVSGNSDAVDDIRRRIQSMKNLTNANLIPLSVTKDDFYTALPKVQPSARREGFASIPETTWADIGALHAVRESLTGAIVGHIKNPEAYKKVGITEPPGVLLWGPTGCGKTLLAKAVANESKANFIAVDGPELLNKWVGETERGVRSVFDRARSSSPCVIFFDELDALTPNRNAASDYMTRVVNTLLTQLDGVSSREGIYVIAATNRPDMIDPAILRPGRFDTKILVDVPEAPERAEILQTLCRQKGIEYTDAVGDIARACEGFSGADLRGLLRCAGLAAIKRNDVVKLEDFISAKDNVRVSVTDRDLYNRLKEDWGTGAFQRA